MQKAEAVLIFGESHNDRAALKELASAIVPHIPQMQLRREPLVLIKGRGPRGAQHAANKIASVVKADGVKLNICAVIAHEDCDAVEPAHEQVSECIEKTLLDNGVPNPIGVAPAYEMEAWWYLWPEAVASVCGRWRKLTRKGQMVGGIVDAKHQLQRDLRPQGREKRAPEYEERHSIKIAEQVRFLGCVDKMDAKSASFDAFAAKLRKVFPSP